jgi:hypothetical protein
VLIAAPGDSNVRLLFNGMSKLFLIGLFIVAGCGGAPAPSRKTPEPDAGQLNVSAVPLSQIDLTKVGAIAGKGRVQDREYNHLLLVETLIAHGNEAVPFLINKLDDKTKVKGHVLDHWPDVRAGDIAFIILTDFFTDPTWQKTTIPGVGYDAFLQRSPNSDVTGEQRLRNYIAQHGRHNITTRWREIWAQYKDRAYWDNNDRCFKIRDS